MSYLGRISLESKFKRAEAYFIFLVLCSRNWEMLKESEIRCYHQRPDALLNSKEMVAFHHCCIKAECAFTSPGREVGGRCYIL